ncbi:MAG TPA: NAD(P)-dependent oxidoreductase [Deinococcales bacterium]|nr:NAD(P)-dependent oxidoreductase [Deinococcales bacterium]
MNRDSSQAHAPNLAKCEAGRLSRPSATANPPGGLTIRAMRVTFIGLGLMGYPMAGHLARHFETTVWNRTPEKAERHAAETGSTAEPSLEAAVRNAEVILSCLPTTAEVAGIVDRVEGALQPGTLWLDCTSGEPQGTRDLAERLQTKGVTLLDCPVSGGTAGAEQGQLTVMVGGEAKDVERARPVLQAFAGRIVHTGPLGTGMAVKAANNTLAALNILGLAELLCALEREGVPTATALEVINHSSGRSNVSENLFPQRVVGRAFPLTFSLGLLAKDVSIAARFTRGLSHVTPITALTDQLFLLARQQVGPDVDHVAAVKLYERWTGVELGHDQPQD